MGAKPIFRSFKKQELIALAALLLFCFLISWHVHARLSWGADDGFYAYMAERMAAGDIIHKDVQVLHPGLLYFWHQLIFHLTDESLVSLRYPLIAITLAQTGLAFMIARSRGLWVAIAAALAMTAFSFVQFVNATPNWYLVFFALVIGATIDKLDVKSTKAVTMIGALVGMAFLLRQLTGVFFALAVTALLFLKSSDGPDENKGITGSVILVLLALSLLVYLFNSSKPIGLLLFGIWPPIFLLCAAKRTTLNWRIAFSTIGKLTLGAFLTALPILMYHAATGTIEPLLKETFIAPFTYHDLGFISESSYVLLPFIAIREMVAGNFTAIFGLMYWTTVLLLNAGLAVITIRHLFKKQHAVSAIAVLAIFHSLVALILEIPLYLNYAVGPVLVALLITTYTHRRRTQLVVLTILLSSVALIFGAGQPMERGRENTVLLKKIDATSHIIPGTSLKASPASADIYTKIIQRIEACSSPEDDIYAFPSNPEIYVFSGRKSAFRFTGSYLGLTNDDELFQVLNSKRPQLIVHNTTDVYNTDVATSFFDTIRNEYVRVDQIERFDIFVRSNTLETFGNCHSPMNG